MASGLDTAGALALLRARETLVLPSARAAQALRDQFDREQRARGLSAWEPPAVLAWTEWTESLWSTLTLEGVDSRVLLNRLQEEVLWAEIIGESREGSRLTPARVADLAALSRSAHQLASAHNVTACLRRTADTADTQAFAAWQRSFDGHCHREQLLSRAGLEAELRRHVHERNASLPFAVHLVGFERLTPAQTLLLEHAGAAGCSVHTYWLQTSIPNAAHRQTAVAADPYQELGFAVQWVRERFRKSPESCTSIALLLPDPAKDRDALEPLLRDVLAPELEPVEADLSSTPWHFSAGPPLASVPVIRDALLVLRWMRESLPLEHVSALLLSPFFGHSDAFEARARFEMHTLRRHTMLRPELALETLLDLSQTPSPRTSQSPLTLTPWKGVRQLSLGLRDGSRTAPHAEWAERVRKVLQAAGWPGPRTLSAAEYRSTEAWESLLDLLATLDLRGQRLTFGAFRQLLEREAQALPAPSAASDVPVQIVTLAEAESCVFDAALVLHATDAHLPPVERPHPLLGWSLQQSLGLPGTDPARTHARSREALRLLADRCGSMVLVAAAADRDGDLRLTPLAGELGFVSVQLADLLKRPLLEHTPLEPDTVPDIEPLPPLPSFEVSKGAHVLELQAACAFRAFASLRLRAGVPERGSLGLNARKSGDLLHWAMEFFWKEVKAQAKLRELSPAERDDVVQRSIEHALWRLAALKAPEVTWAETYLAVVGQRLAILLRGWLTRELSRPAFTVRSSEESQSITVGPLDLSIRPDRIDDLDGGGTAYIDYKTGSSLSANDWIGERPAKPQLPLYALLGRPDEVRGIAFASIRPGKGMKWVALEDRGGPFRTSARKGQPVLKEEIASWHDELSRLASDFAAGEARVDPKTFPTTCKYCEHSLLCRRDAATLLARAEVSSERSPGRGDG